MIPVVFVGPSLDRELAARELEAEFLPPIARGDIDALLERDEPPPAIGIIDGKFLQSLSISPKEVLRAVDRGIAVFGSSSMGALRAVECVPFGMVGVGRIFEEYDSGRIDADDEVAIVYDDDSLRALSEPMVNLRFAIAAGLSAGSIDAETADRFLTIAKSLYFPERTVPNVVRLLRAEVGDERAEAVTRFFADGAPDTKHDDALALLRCMREHLAKTPESARIEVSQRGLGVR